MSEGNPKVLRAGTVKFAFFKRQKAKWENFKVQAQIPTNSLLPRVIGATLAWTIVYNVGVYFWKGPDHPINNFWYRRMREKGTLPPDVRAKGEMIEKATSSWIDQFYGGRNFWQYDRSIRDESPKPWGVGDF
ncbi:unnamed protein product [Bursaphelenchus xylophilus]|uniref:(pine wood nematode) hypothetical protein n=1 Tax=Bursaphelenchus xylophilus TaxID=6326 RepID=A0A1I7SLL6_BURXY|nr:unnamed protein product [Bursaphelenchus xylophilus]CAG9129663.1 unnamed protein product [Bursaphelenchus xylophilus]